MTDKICMLVLSSYPFDPRVRRQAEVLENAGYKIDIICLREKNQTKVEKIGRVTVYRVMNSLEKEKILKYLWLSFSFFIVSFFKILQLSIIKKYQLIEIHNMPDFLVFAALFQKLAGKSVLLDMHDLTVELYETKWPAKRKNFAMTIVRKVESLSCSFADHIITVTEACKRKLIERGVPDKKITLILNTADPKIFIFDNRRTFEKIERGAKLLYHGTVAERFGIHTAIEAIALLQSSIPNSSLAIYGKYDLTYRNKLEALIKNLGVEQFVSLNGVKNLEEIYNIIKASDIGLVPYINDPYMNIALSTKTFEYAASGLPVVASNLDALALVFDEYSLKFAEAENPQSFTAGIIDLCFNPSLRCKYSENASNAVQGISGTVMAQRYLELVKTFS